LNNYFGVLRLTPNAPYNLYTHLTSRLKWVVYLLGTPKAIETVSIIAR